MGGGACRARPGPLSSRGLSPRGRGSLLRLGNQNRFSGSIPAWAGEPFPPQIVMAGAGVYPRVGGGAENEHGLLVHATGLSPRGRGSPDSDEIWSVLSGSIPAWAGEPQGRRQWMISRRVYPRVGGGAKMDGINAVRRTGLSPRGRGSLSSMPGVISSTGSIPAWAGEPLAASNPACGTRVYPRVGGGAWQAMTDSLPSAGLSPRGRGSRRLEILPQPQHGSIPAWAGEPYGSQPTSADLRVYPRVGGGAFRSETPISSTRGLSPRGRGSLGREKLPTILVGSIPAWAGEPRQRRFADRPGGVYPRVGGGAHGWSLATRLLKGLSPRGRGSHRRISIC